MHHDESDDVELGARGVVPRTEHEAVIQQIKTEANDYSSRKSVAQENQSVTTIIAKIGLIVGLFKTNDNIWNDDLLVTTFVILIIAVFLDTLIGIFIAILFKTDSDNVSRNCTTKALNNAVTALSFLSTIINGVVTSLSTISVVKASS